MANSILTKTEIETIFNRLRSIPTNKSCFDCGAKNPTWASVTYGVFICIDCSAVHRGLGVHLTFVRSTNLDTNWTWIQIRQMQLSGNANAAQFFRQHNCNTTDAQQKYNSRAAQLYRDKLVNSAHQAMKLHGNTLHIDSAHENVNTLVDNKKEDDFFAECASDDFLNNKINNSKTLIGDIKNEDNTKKVNISLKDDSLSQGAPNVDFFNTTMPTEPIKSTIGVRKIAPRKTGLGAKKTGGLGATKVKTNFADIEHKANLADQIKETIPEKKLTCEEEADAIANVRLAYQDLSLKQNKEEEKLKATDPTKAKQMERLGMGFNFNNAKGGVSHSALTDMHTIAQENAPKTNSRQFERDSFDLFADYDTNMYSDTSSASTKLDSELIMMGFETIEPLETRPQNIKSMFSSNNNKSISDQPTSYNRSTNNANNNRTGNNSGTGVSSRLTPSPYKTYENDAAQKKFGGAKAISSDQYFGNNSNNGDGSTTSPTSSSSFEQSTNLARFQGSNSISSSDYFGDSANNRSRGGNSGGGGGSGIKNYSMEFQGPHMDDVKKSVREGVTKVADRLSNLANDVMSSIQDKYGY